MGIDISLIDSEIARLQDIKRVLSDPRSTALVQELLSRNGTNSAPLSVAKTEAPKQAIDDEESINTQIGAIREAIRSTPTRFSVGMIGDLLRDSGVMAITNVQVGKVLQRLQKRGEIRRVVKGRGNSPNKYERTETFGLEQPDNDSGLFN